MSGPGLLRRRTPVALVALVAAGLAASVGGATSSTAAPEPATTHLQLLSFNDFHGQIEEPTGSSSRIDNFATDAPAYGGAEFLATHLAQLRSGRSLTVAAGDLIGASPLLSAAFHDEPTIETMNALGLDLSSVGNHEFDEGAAELLRMQNGGCLPDGDGENNQNSCPIPGHDFAGADFQYLAANVVRESNGKTLFPATKIKSVAGQKVAFIGMTLEGTPSIVTPSGVAGLDFRDEVETANSLVPALQSKGVEAVVVLLHEGGIQSGTFNACAGISDPLLTIAQTLSPEIDAVISGHTHAAYNCLIPDPAGHDRMVTSAASFGRVITEMNLTIDNQTHDVVRDASTAVNHLVTRSVPRDPAITSIRSAYDTIIAPIRDEVVGFADVPLARTSSSNPVEAQLGDVIADAQLAATSDPADGGAQIAFMNPGGVRADLNQGDITYGEAFAVQPFANVLTTVTLTGDQIRRILEQQKYGLTSTGAVSATVLQPSKGFTYTFDTTQPAGSRVSNIQLNGAPLDMTATYRVTANNFLTTGGDGFTVFKEATNVQNGAIDLDAFVAYMGEGPLTAPEGFRRINLITAG
jgi:5'-nucleotidase